MEKNNNLQAFFLDTNIKKTKKKSLKNKSWLEQWIGHRFIARVSLQFFLSLSQDNLGEKNLNEFKKLWTINLKAHSWLKWIHYHFAHSTAFSTSNKDFCPPLHIYI